VIDAKTVLELINNLDHREAVRRYAPAWSVVMVSEQLDVVAVQRFKERPSLAKVDILNASHKNCTYFYAEPGMYSTVEALHGKIQGCAEAFRIQWSNLKS